MKTITFLLFLGTVFSLAAQHNYMFDMEIVSNNTEGTDTIFLHMAKAPKKLALRVTTSDFNEFFVVDSTQNKVVELIDEMEGKEAYVSYFHGDQDEEMYGNTVAGDFVMMEGAGEQDYKLLPEKRTMFGYECQKVVLLSEGQELGTGWIALGVHMGMENGSGFFDTPKGMLVDFQITDAEGTTLKLKLVRASKIVSNPQSEFSLLIPEGYELFDEADPAYYDDEEEE